MFCDGTCNTWLHRGCAGLSKIAFKKVASSSHPFYCTHCSLSEQKKEIEVLKGTVEKLSSDLRTVSSMLAKISSEKKSPQEDSRISQQLKLTTDDSSSVGPPSHKPPSTSPRPSSVTEKFNIIVKGLPEHPQGTPQHIRLNNDYGEVNSVLQRLDPSSHIQPCVRDCRRIGKYDVSKPRPRPIRVTLNSTMEVANVLSKCRSLTPPIIIKADLTPTERKNESILLKERRKLIDSGHERRSIRIRKTSLYLNGRLHGTVENFSYQQHPLLADFIPDLNQRLKTPNNCLDDQQQLTSSTSHSTPRNSPSGENQ